jgi:hypothetical protein
LEEERMQKIGVSLLAIVMITAGCGQSKKVADPFLSPPKPNNLTAKQTIYNTPAKMKAIEWTPYDIAITAVAAVAVVGGGYLWYQNYQQGQQIENLASAFTDFKKQTSDDIDHIDKTLDTAFALVGKEIDKQDKKIEDKLGKGEAAQTYAFKPVLIVEEEEDVVEVEDGKDVPKTKKVQKEHVVEIGEFVDRRTWSYEEQDKRFLTKEEGRKFADANHTHTKCLHKKKAAKAYAPIAHDHPDLLPKKDANFAFAEHGHEGMLTVNDISSLPFAPADHDHKTTDAQIGGLQSENEKIHSKLKAIDENASFMSQEIQRLQKNAPSRKIVSTSSSSSEEKLTLSGVNSDGNLEVSSDEEALQNDLTPAVFKIAPKKVEQRISHSRSSHHMRSFTAIKEQHNQVEVRKSIPRSPAEQPVEQPAEQQQADPPAQTTGEGAKTEDEPIVEENIDQNA